MRARSSSLPPGSMPVRSISAGAIAFTVTPSPPTRDASQCAIPCSPAFEAGECGPTTPPVNAATDETNRIRPNPRSRMPGATRRASRNGALRFTAMWSSQSASVTSSIACLIRPTPAFGTSTSTGPSSRSTSSTSWSSASRSDRSAPAVSTRAPGPASSRARSSARAASCAYESATDAPACATSREIAAPMPPLAPVTSATRPARASLTNRQRVDDEHERGVRRDRGRVAPRAVGELRRDDQLAPAAGLDAHEPLVPALDHRALAELELERLAPVPRGVELVAVRIGHADVLHREPVALLRRAALAGHDVLHHELLGRRPLLLGDGRLRLRVLQVRRRLGRWGRAGGGAGRDVGGRRLAAAAAAARDGDRGSREQGGEVDARLHGRAG